MSRTPSSGMPAAVVCHAGLPYPWHVPPTMPLAAASPVAQRLGPPLPAVTASKLYSHAVELPQKPDLPLTVLKPKCAAMIVLAQESFQGISGIYDSAEAKV